MQQAIGDPDHWHPDQCRRVIGLDRLEQDESSAFEFETAGTVVRLIVSQVGLRETTVEIAKAHDSLVRVFVAGAAHGVEIPFVFDNFSSGFLARYVNSEGNRPGREALASSMSSYWAEFADRGAPGRGRDGKQPEWRPWENGPGKADKFVIFDTPADGGIRMSSETMGLEEVRARLLAETGFRDQEDHCEMYVAALADSELWDDEEYASLGREGCGSYPKQAYSR